MLAMHSVETLDQAVNIAIVFIGCMHLLDITQQQEGSIKNMRLISMCAY